MKNIKKLVIIMKEEDVQKPIPFLMNGPSGFPKAKAFLII
jgi:hypothetical protein